MPTWAIIYGHLYTHAEDQLFMTTMTATSSSSYPFRILLAWYLKALWDSPSQQWPGNCIMTPNCHARTWHHLPSRSKYIGSSAVAAFISLSTVD